MSGDLSVTAKYTSATWAWGKLPNADLLLTPDAERVFRIVNGALGLTRPFTGAPELPASLLERHRILDELVTASDCSNVIELAAGLSRRGITMSEDPSMYYVEIDLPHVVDAKRAILEKTERGRSALARPNFTIESGDITAVDLAAVHAHAEGSVFVIAEGLLMYLDEAAKNKLFDDVARRLEKCGGCFAFDLVPTSEQKKPGVVGNALGRAMKLFTKGATFVRDARTRGDIRGELLQHGFDSVDLIEPNAPMSGRGRVEQLVFFCRRAAK
ncbi:MAG: class I SAM-dependent methyltransferase [Polyangiaceae bacterium]